MGRKMCIVVISAFTLVPIAFAQQTISIGDFEFTLGGNIRGLYTGYMFIDEYGHYVNQQRVLPEVARFTFSGKYGEHLNAYFEGGYFKGWAYQPQWEWEEYQIVRTDEWFYLGHLDINLGIFGVSGGLNFVPTGIEPTTRDVDLAFLRPSIATLFLTPMRKPGISFMFKPFRTEERDIISLSLGIYDDIYPFLSEEEKLVGFDRRFLFDLPYITSLDMNLIKPIRITGYYGRDIAWREKGEKWEATDSNVYTLCGAGASLNMFGFGASLDFFYEHLISRGEGEKSFASNGGQLTVFYKTPSLGFITIEPTFRGDIYNPQKHEKYDKTITYTYGLNIYALEDHLRVMMNYYHPTEEKGKYIDMTTANDEIYIGLQLAM